MASHDRSATQTPAVDHATLLSRARDWAAGDPDPDTRAELEAVVEAGDTASLLDLVGSSLAFGTAGLRGEVGPGPNRMNRAVVIRATRGLADHLLASVPGAAERGVIVGFDARPDSQRFARDVVSVLRAAGLGVAWFPTPIPTPLVAWAAHDRGAAGAVVVTASHNPPADNGYKVYDEHAVQITPPTDAAIASAIEAVGPAAQVPGVGDPLDAAGPPLVELGEADVAAYLTAIAAARPDVDGDRSVPLVVTPMHGVGGDILERALQEAGFTGIHRVTSQWEPDGSFPTVPFPNPEEPGALDLALALASGQGADVVLAHDPDADRLAVALPTAGAPGGWRALTGDEIGVVLADWLLAQGSGADRLVETTIVSSSMLGRLAAARGVAYAETLTGFKWLARAALDRPDLRFVYGYEEALGSCVGTLVRDKDGITAALAFAELVAAEKARGRSVLDRLDDLARELGVHATGQRSIRFEGVGGLERMRAVVDALAASPPALLAGVPVDEVEDLRLGGRLPPTDGVALRGAGVRLIVRPSGTEPKLKCYAEAVVPVAGGVDLAAARERATGTTAAILDEAVALAD